MDSCGFDGRVALVTGGASGIGAATARLLRQRGARIVVADLNRDLGSALANELGDEAEFVCLDVSIANDWAAGVKFAEDRFGAISVLVNNAGMATVPAPLDQTDEEDFRRIFEVNQLSCFLGMKAVTRSMRRAGSGSIVNISSVAGLKAVAGAIAYVGSKFAVTGMTKVAALDLAGDNIRVNSVHPGLVDTPMVRPGEGSAEAFQPVLDFAMTLPIPRPGHPQEIAELISFLASDAASFITGSSYAADGGWTLS